MIMTNLYERYHKNIKLQKKIIDKYDFTYRNTLTKIEKYIPKKGRVLDIGSATGTISFYFASRGLFVDGIELSKNAIKYAILNQRMFGLKNIRFFNKPIENLKTKFKYNLITCLEVLEHIEDDATLLKFLSRRMANNSKLIITVPSINAPLYRLGLLKKFDIEVGHLRRYSSSGLRSLLKQSGFNIISEYKCEGVIRSVIFTNKIFDPLIRLTKFRIINDALNFVDQLSLKLFAESQLIFVCNINKK